MAFAGGIFHAAKNQYSVSIFFLQDLGMLRCGIRVVFRKGNPVEASIKSAKNGLLRVGISITAIF